MVAYSPGQFDVTYYAAYNSTVKDVGALKRLRRRYAARAAEAEAALSRYRLLLEAVDSELSALQPHARRNEEFSHRGLDEAHSAKSIRAGSTETLGETGASIAQALAETPAGTFALVMTWLRDHGAPVLKSAAHPEPAVRAAISRLVKRGVIERPSHGQLRLSEFGRTLLARNEGRR